MEVLIGDLTEQIARGVSLSLLNINLLSVAALKPRPSFCQDMLKAFGVSPEKGWPRQEPIN